MTVKDNYYFPVHNVCLRPFICICYHYLVTQPHPLIGMKGLLMYAALNPHEFGTL